MKIKFLQGFGGRETGEVHYIKGQIIDEEHGAGGLANLASRGIVEILPEEPEAASKPIVNESAPKKQPPVVKANKTSEKK